MSQNTVGITVTADDKTRAGLDSARKSAEGLKASLKDVGKIAAGVLTADLTAKAGAAFGQFVNTSIKASSDLGESLNAVNVTFGASAKTITDWGKTNANAYGLSQRAFNQLATPLGAMLKNTGMSLQDTSKWTIDLTKRAADMASVFNTSVEDALGAIQAGLRGELDPLERFGVGLNAAKVEAAALAATGKTAASALTDQEKATARLGLIMKQTAQVAGDFQNTSDGFANSQRKAQAAIEEAQASLGQSLLPVLAKVAQVTASAAQGFAALPGPLQATVIAAGTLGAGAVLLGGKIRGAREELGKLADATYRSDGRMGTLTRSAGRVAGVFAAISTAGAVLGKDMSVGVNTATTALEQFAATGKKTESVGLNLDDAWKWIADDARWDNRAANDALKVFESLTNTGGVIGDSWQHAQQAFSSADAALAGMVQSGKKAQAEQIFTKLAEDAAKQDVSVEQLKRQLPQYQDALAGAAREAKSAGGAVQGLTKSLKQQREEAAKAADGLSDTRSAARDLEAAYDSATEALKKNGRSLDIGSEKGRDNQAALDGIADAARASAAAVLASTGSQRQANIVLATAQSRLTATAVKFGMTKAAARAYAQEILGIPQVVTTDVRVTGVQRAMAQVRAIANRANLADARGYAHGGIVGTAASGGPRSGEVLVGEQGPELVKLPAGAHVQSNPDTRRILTSRLRTDLAKGLGSAVDGSANDVAKWMAKLIADVKAVGDKGAVTIVQSLRDKMVAAAKQRDAVAGPLREAAAEFRRQYSERVTSVQGGLIGDAGIGGANGTFGNITGRLARMVERSRRFASVLARLRVMGLDKVSIQQLVDAGPDLGLQSAESILAMGKSGVAQVAGLQGQVASAARGVGVQAAETDYRASITTADKRLATATAGMDRRMDALADSLVKALRRRIKGMASGGVAWGGSTLVGEHGPEVVDMPSGAMVRPRVTPSAGGPVQVALVVDSAGSRLDDLLVEIIRQAVRVRGGTVQSVLGAA